MTSGFEEFERRSLQRLIEIANQMRLFLLLALASLAVWMSIADPARWRPVMMGTTLVFLAGLDLKTRRLFSKEGPSPRLVTVNVSAMLIAQVLMLFAVGGLASPVVLVMIPPAFSTGLFLGYKGMVRLVLGVQLPALLLFCALHLTGALPSFVPEPFRPQGGLPPATVILATVAMSTLLPAFSAFGAVLRRTIRAGFARVATAQEATLAVHRQRLDELTLLSGQIAHELKNPLASVKGLSQLLERQAPPDGKSKERLEVLSREVGRMESIVEEFLNFSRPLMPLERGALDIGSLCHETAVLHEAAAAEAGVVIDETFSGDLRAQADERKIAQVLINLLQNALEVAPAQSRVRLQARGHEDGIEVRVRDEGPGIAADVLPRLFEPGVTTKDAGNGLGLTIARAIAEQHGGTLALRNLEDGGCEATLTLPRTGAA